MRISDWSSDVCSSDLNAERKFFPGYVLAKMEMTDETYHLVKNTPKVTGFLSSGGKPSPITDAEAQRIANQVKEGVEHPKPSVTRSEERRVGKECVSTVRSRCCP